MHALPSAVDTHSGKVEEDGNVVGARGAQKEMSHETESLALSGV